MREIYASLSRVRRLGARHRIRRLQKVHCNGPIPVFVVLIPLLIYFGRGLITPVSPIPGNVTHCFELGKQVRRGVHDVHSVALVVPRSVPPWRHFEPVSQPAAPVGHHLLKSYRRGRGGLTHSVIYVIFVTSPTSGSDPSLT